MNEAIFFFQILVVLSFVLIAFRLGYAWLIALVAVMATLMNVYVTKFFTLFGLAVTGGNVLYAAIFLSTDMIEEHYGRRRALAAVAAGFLVSLFFLVTSRFILAYRPNGFDTMQPHLVEVFRLTPRIVAASMFTYLIAQTGDVFLFGRLRRLTRGRALWLRNCGSTFVSQFIDTVVFTYLAFYGVVDALWEMILFTYIVKLVVAVMDTPFLYLSKLPFFMPAELRVAKK